MDKRQPKKDLTPTEKAAREKKPIKPRNSTAITPEAEVQRGAALALYDFNGGKRNAIGYTAKILGIPRKTLDDWIKGRGKGNEARQEARTLMKGVLVEHVEDAIIRMLGRTERAAEVAAEAGKLQQIAVSVAILQDKRADLLGLPVRRYSADTAGQTPTVPMPAGTIADTPVNRTDIEKYESVIETIIAEGVKEGKTITRDQAMEQIIKLKPEAANVLKFPTPDAKTG